MNGGPMFTAIFNWDPTWDLYTHEVQWANSPPTDPLQSYNQRYLIESQRMGHVAFGDYKSINPIYMQQNTILTPVVSRYTASQSPNRVSALDVNSNILRNRGYLGKV